MNQPSIRVAAYTGGISVPSARYRVRQYVRRLRNYGVDVHEFAPRLGTYPSGHKIFRPAWAVCSLAERSTHVVQSYKYDVTLLQREMLSTKLTLEPLTRAPRALDVDDAIWIRRSELSSRVLSRLATVVICGNSFLGETFSKWNANVVVLPTAVDTDAYRPAVNQRQSERRLIGWSGTSSGFPYLYEIEETLAQILRMYSHARLRIVSDKKPRFRRIPAHKVEFVPWTPETEVTSIQNLDVGIMPLRDTEWERGKCSLKMLTYMACEVPVVVSNVGTNKEILRLGPCGFGASTWDEWVCSINDILSNPKEATELGRTGREIVLRHYSVDALAPRLADILKRIA